jgi:hypothetical protein
MPREEPLRTDWLDGSVTTASDARGRGSAQQIGKLIYWIASALAVIALGVAAYVAVAEQRPFN